MDMATAKDWWDMKRPDLADDDVINWLLGEAERVPKLEAALTEIMENGDEYCTTCEENGDTATLALERG